MSQEAPYALPFTYIPPQQQQQYPTLNNNIMMVAVVLLFAVIFFILAIHIYAKWFWRRSFFVRVSTGTGQARAAAPHGLDKSVIDSLPMFVYNKKSVGHGGTDPDMDMDMDMDDPVLECPVCLSEFQENEKGRQIPSCKHRFHVECIDMWLFSHSTCPLCRTEVLLAPSPDGRSHGSLDTNPNPNPHPGLPPENENENENENVSTNSHGHISVDIPSRELDMAASCASDAGQSDPSAKSPGLRNSFKRIMGRQSSRVSAAAEISGNDA